ncbi:FkbM family methyltransferase [Asticcacaulis sp. ZE23SCel15]|uniref:FkbM family methyltransferase n=1 Tax=Asticcacaulis sp. ZE23SCel15 TaxID=3059027 RepID=UPI00265F6E80|nr:FkbM family methyltransferase [Asticcacaulis sp. ZE23SCel15]WKL55885.1 FkbM family methyltransferase [Asticcacaulis sp. ZE23SCel15]
MKTAIYGAGKSGRVLLGEMAQRGETADFFIDEFSPEPQVSGLPVKRMADIADKSDIRLMVSLHNGTPSATDIHTFLADSLSRQGFGEIHQWQDLALIYPALIDAVASHSVNPNEPGLKVFRDMLSDDISREILDTVIAFRQNFQGPLTGLPDQYAPYFPAGIDVFRGMKSLRFADCGAYDGDTIQSALKKSPVPVSWFAAFEPDPDIFERLRARIDGLKPQFEDTDFWLLPFGAWSKNDVLKFNALNTVCSSFMIGVETAPVTISVPVVSLDATLSASPPNFIKMDIEGAEIEAITGARHIIETYRPTLALSIYHLSHHLWEIPAMIKSYYPGYEMYLRHHSAFVPDTVLYCIAPDGPLVTG